MVRPFHCKPLTLVSPQLVGSEMNLFSEDDEESLPGQDADNMDIEETRVCYPETSLESTRRNERQEETGQET